MMRSSRLRRTAAWLVRSMCGALAACASVPTVQIDPGPDAGVPSSAAGMLLVVHDEGGLRGLVGGEQPLKDITREVKEGLVRSGYTVSDPWDLGLDYQALERLAEGRGEIRIPAKGYTHLLRASVYPRQRGQAPAGLSLSLGASDPRSGDAPRGEAIPVSCSLIDLKGRHEEAHVDDVMPIAQGGWLSGRAPPGGRIQAVAEHLGAICHALIAELQVAHAAPQSPVAEPRSTIRVEVTPATEPALPAGTSPAAPAGVVTSSATEPVPHGKAPAEAPAVTTQHGVDKGGRKQIKIFNQGDTLILEFGHDRK